MLFVRFCIYFFRLKIKCNCLFIIIFPNFSFLQALGLTKMISALWEISCTSNVLFHSKWIYKLKIGFYLFWKGNSKGKKKRLGNTWKCHFDAVAKTWHNTETMLKQIISLKQNTSLLLKWENKKITHFNAFLSKCVSLNQHAAMERFEFEKEISSSTIHLLNVFHQF